MRRFMVLFALACSCGGPKPGVASEARTLPAGVEVHEMRRSRYAMSQAWPVEDLESGPGLTLLAEPQEDRVLLRLVNGSDSTFRADACNNGLCIVQEALDDEGNWRPIEAAPWSTCGNSYHPAYLPARHYWEFQAPKYRGSLITTMRFRLRLRERDYHSNEFPGSVNPGQFTRRPAGFLPENGYPRFD